MEILKITISGFKNIENTTIEFNHPITAIVGPNGYGKSNLLQALEFGNYFIKSDEIEKSFFMKRPSFIPINKNMINSEFHYEIEFKTTFVEKEVVVNYGYKFMWPSKDIKPLITAEWLKIKPNEKGKRYSEYIRRTSDKAFIKPSPKDRCDKEIKIENNNLVINKLKSDDELFYHKIVNDINKLNIEMITKVLPEFSFHLIPSKGNVPKLTIEETVLFDILPTVYDLKKNYPEKFEYLMNAFKEIFPSIEELDVAEVKPQNIFKGLLKDEEFVDKIYIMRVKEKNLTKSLDILSLSRGTLRILAFLTSLILADIKGYLLIGFEELEDSIHPKLLQKLLMVLSNMSDNCKIIITSHSPYLIQFLDIDNIYLAVPNDKGIATFKKLPLSKRNKIYNNLREMGISLGDYIFEMYINPEEEFLQMLGVRDND
ncbi:putative ATPase [Caldicellulosiruptor bescii]|uniref:SMC domain protein n=2 Tax=Caldicellulosiruptor bescii TaxID=31899 RepID=B9MN17_CALBD|nr:ATP-binding protein [Caldicellulosiruptor bescii]ACM59473.1 SMC domain protein [Caldicellulosiruptor bescii DSM 6725]PBC89506.1 putative ATPase [Caldicellulosiruptor bescii]PBC89828.1 putative ATPase [Caldicellulosiruptor bescii]PBD04745.1 putative ATPase [Caldicellulosiruptor bescii]PBD05624.1 putative ATPase [Caldicellulosiruptor bescii]